jgi:alpha-L-fucosidase 2
MGTLSDNRPNVHGWLALRPAAFSLWAAMLLSIHVSGQTPRDIGPLLDSCNVSWDVPGPGPAESMPIGNGDIGLNVWTEPNGDLLFYIGKTDAWGGEVSPDMDPWMKQGGVLMKLGAVRVSVSGGAPEPGSSAVAPGSTAAGAGAPGSSAAGGTAAGSSATGTFFRQTLRLLDGEIRIREGGNDNAVLLRVWVDANHPVIRVEANSKRPVSVKVTLYDWRIGQGDTILTGLDNRITWYHRNGSPGDPHLSDPHLADLTFGAVMKGRGFSRIDKTSLNGNTSLSAKDGMTDKEHGGTMTLQSDAAATSHLISIYPLTAATANAGEWLDRLDAQMAGIDHLGLEQTRSAHQQWWDRFWHRSWIFVQDAPAIGQGAAPGATPVAGATAKAVTQGYVLQRFVTACAGRGAYPIKFNGSIFVVGDPRLKSGKNAPWAIANEGSSISNAGASMGNTGSSTGSAGASTASGGASLASADFRSWGGQYWFQNTRAMYWPRLMAGDFDEMLPLFNMYAKILPGNAALVKKYYGHEGAYFAETAPFWGGLLYMGPEAEARYTNHYFTPILELTMMMLDYFEYTSDTIFVRKTLLPVATAGLQFFDRHFGRDAQGKLLLDPDNSIEMFWKVHDPAPDIAGLHAVLARMIALPDRLVDPGIRAGWKNMLAELPELPVAEKDGQPVLLPYTGEQTAKSFNFENPELYAIYPFRLYGLGKPDLSLALNTFNARTQRDKGCWVQDPIQAAMLGLADIARDYTGFDLTRKEPGLKFPAFWAIGHDYTPDEDNGGNGENGLQQMLLQADGRKILLLPAWPKGWDADFKLNAPYRTTVQGMVENGKLIRLVVTPASRRADIIDMSSRGGQ